ncbi:MAG: hypothetical protein MHM6MM_004891 [Cercozoa sp. M6MM]
MASTRIFGDVTNRFSLEALLKTSDVSSSVQRHLVRVYSLLATVCGAAVAGTLLNVVYGVGDTLLEWPLLSILLTVGSLMGVFFTSRDNVTRRTQFLLFFGALNGLLIAPLVELSLEINPGILVGAIGITLGVFVSFTAAALSSQRRSYIGVFGVLGAVVSTLLVLQVLSIFVPSTLNYTLQLYLGAVMMALYVLADTQMIVARAERGNADHVQDALSLFQDLFSLLVRVLIILLQKQAKRDSSSRGSSHSRSRSRKGRSQRVA